MENDTDNFGRVAWERISVACAAAITDVDDDDA